MNYHISINQRAALALGLSLIEAVIADAFRGMLSSPKIEEKIHGNTSYKWVAVQKLIDDLPLLDLKPRAMAGYIASLEAKGVIQRCPENQKLGKGFFKAGQNFDALFNDDTYAKNCIPPMQKIAYNPNTNNPDTNNSLFFSENQNSQNEIPSYLEQSRAKVMEAKNTPVNPIESYKQTPMPNGLEGAKEAFCMWLDDQGERGKKVTRQQCEVNLKILLGCEDLAHAIESIKDAITGGWSKFYVSERKKPQSQQNGPQRGGYAPKKDLRLTGSNFD